MLLPGSSKPRKVVGASEVIISGSKKIVPPKGGDCAANLQERLIEHTKVVIKRIRFFVMYNFYFLEWKIL